MAHLELDDRGIVVTCGSCGQRNRVAYGHMSDEAKCGRCKTLLSPTATPLEIDSAADFDQLIAHASVPVIVDYWAPWCGPCRMVAPELAKVAARSAGKFLIVKVNTDALNDLGERYRIRSIPTMAIFSGGREVTRTTGARPAADIERFISGAVPASSPSHNPNP
jgi:thioredoxin 2